MFTRKRAGDPGSFSSSRGIIEGLRDTLRQRAFVRYLVVKAASQGGDGIFQQATAAVLLFEQASDNPAMDLLRITAVILIPFSIVGPLAGVFIDRVDRRKILIYTPVVRALLAAIIPIAAMTTEGPWFFAIVLTVLSINRFFLATLGAVLPQLVPPEDLLVANATSSTSGAVSNVIGHAAGSVIAEVAGGRTTAAVAAAAFAWSGLLARPLPVHRGLIEEPAPLGEEIRRTVSEMRDGFDEMRTHPRVRFGMAAIGMMQVFIGAMVAILIYYLVAELGLGPASGFAMLAFLAVGIGAGVVLVPLFAQLVGNDRTIPWAFVIGAVGPLLATLALSRTTLAVAAGFVGLSYSLAKIPVDTLVQEEIADSARGRAFALYDMLFNLARVVGTAALAVGYLIGFGTRPLMFLVGISFLLTAAWAWRTLRAVESGAASAPARVAEPSRSVPAGVSSFEEAPSVPLRATSASRPLFEAGDLVIVRAHAGGRADEEPRAIVLGPTEIPLTVRWRAVCDEGGTHWRVFVVDCAGQRLRLRIAERGDRWEIERIIPFSTS